MKYILTLVLVLYLLLVGLVTFVGYDSIKHSHDSQRATVALCALRDSVHANALDRLGQIERGEKYLAANPNGAPGISRNLILQGINGNRTALHQLQRTLASLRVLRCQ